MGERGAADRCVRPSIERCCAFEFLGNHGSPEGGDQRAEVDNYWSDNLRPPSHPRTQPPMAQFWLLLWCRRHD